MSAIVQALGAGYSAKKILSYLSQHNPQIANKITAALNAGHTIDHVLNFIQKNSNRIGKLIPEKQKQEKPQNLFKESQSNIHPSLKGMAQAGLATAGIVGGSYALSRAIPNMLGRTAIQAGMQPGLSVQPSSISSSPTSPLTNALGQQPQVHQQQSLQQTQQPPINQVNPSITQPINIQQPEVKSINLDEILTKHNSKQKINELIGSGNNAEAIKGYFGKFAPKELKEIEKESGQPFEKIIEQYMAERPQETKLEESIEEKPTEPIKVEKKSLVSSPNGIGEVKEIRNGQALVDIDGKLYKVKEEDLETSPIPEKDLSDLYDDLLRGIESETGEDVSRMVQWAGYNPETNTLQFLPHTGKLYTYGDISEEDATLLRDILSTRKTTGSNFIGAWKADSKSPIGAALSKLIRKLQSERGGKGQEYEASFEPIYSAYEPAIQAKKEKMRKKKK